MFCREARQDAFTAAVEQWPSRGIPANPSAWLIQIGRNKAVDQIRREVVFRTKIVERETATAAADAALIGDDAEPCIEDSYGDDRLRLIFTCCHPALNREARIALTLREVCGLTTLAVARAFLVGEDTMAQRLRAQNLTRSADCWRDALRNLAIARHKIHFGMHPVDVVIAGGGAVGSATAYFLVNQPAFSGSIVVIEPDPTYAFAASALSASSIRRQFSTPLNIALSAFGFEFLRDCARSLADVNLQESTYLYLASSAGASTLRENVALQRRCGVDARLFDAAGLRARHPWINACDLAAAADTSSGEGWFDGYGLLRGLRQANERGGVRYVRDRVAAVIMGGAHSVAGVRLGGGATLRCRWLVNAAGTHSRALAAHAGIDLPVYARKRNVFVFTSASPPADCPMVIDPSGLWFRPEASRFICGVVPSVDPNVELDDFEVDHQLFDDVAWPALAHRVPAFEAIRVAGAWAGHYDYNVFDQNAFLGACETVPNLILASGFSGHGLQQAPAVGRALAEFIACGDYRTIDVAPFAYSRYVRGRPLREHNVI